MEQVCLENWYALQTLPQSEQAVSAQLSHVGIQAFLPMTYGRCTKGRTETVKWRPLFPSYVFCRLNLNSGPRLYLISSVIRIVGAGKRPIPINDSEIESVQKLVTSPYQVETEAPPKVGDLVHITAGPFAGMVGTLIDFRGKWKFVVTISLLNRSVSVIVPKEWLIASTVAA